MADFSNRPYTTDKKKHVKVVDSYKVWRGETMEYLIFKKLGSVVDLRNLTAIKIEWWLHNIGYYLTKPFIFIPAIKKLNDRFKDVDLMVTVVV